MKLVKNIPRMMWWFKPMHGSILWRHRKSNMKFYAKMILFECIKRQSKMLFLSCENRVLDDESNDQNKRKRCIYRGQELATWKDKIALWNRRSGFHSAARPQNSTAEWVPREQGKRRRFHSAVPWPPIMTAVWDRENWKRYEVRYLLI